MYIYTHTDTSGVLVLAALTLFTTPAVQLWCYIALTLLLGICVSGYYSADRGRLAQQELQQQHIYMARFTASDNIASGSKCTAVHAFVLAGSAGCGGGVAVVGRHSQPKSGRHRQLCLPPPPTHTPLLPSLTGGTTTLFSKPEQKKGTEESRAATRAEHSFSVWCTVSPHHSLPTSSRQRA